MFYFPYVRGRRFELIGLRKASEKRIVDNNIIPVIEPVQLNTTLLKTLEVFDKNHHPVIIVRNPQVGAFLKELKMASNKDLAKRFENLLKSTSIYNGLIFKKSDIRVFNSVIEEDKPLITIFSGDRDDLKLYSLVEQKPDNCKYHLGPGTKWFDRRVKIHKFVFEDHFNAMTKNADYLQNEDEFFSSDYLDYTMSDGYEGFSDFSIIGGKYSEGGFAPYAVAIHFIYVSDDGEIRVHHFVSDTNEDYSDTPGKYKEASDKLMNWIKEHKTDKYAVSFLNTWAVAEFKDLARRGAFPGLGAIKEYSLLQHIEVIHNLLSDKQVV